MEPQSNEPLRITINTFGSRAHQVGRGPGREGAYTHGSWPAAHGESGESFDGPVTVHVQDGKPLTPLGRKLMGL